MLTNTLTGSLASWVECLRMVRKTGVQSQVESYQRLKKRYLILPCLPLSILRYVSSIKWSNPGERVASPLHLGVVAIEKGAFGSPSTTVANLTYKKDLGLDRLKWLICHKIKPSQIDLTLILFLSFFLVAFYQFLCPVFALNQETVTHQVV